MTVIRVTTLITVPVRLMIKVTTLIIVTLPKGNKKPPMGL